MGEDEPQKTDGDEKEENKVVDNETNVGKKLSDLTTKRVVIIVMLLMISIPIFNADTYFQNKSIYEQGVQELYKVLKIEGTPNEKFDEIWNIFL